jgi:serine/threonine protein kinase
VNEESLFIEALEIRDPSERAQFLERACAGDAAVRGRLEQLLVQHERAGSFLRRPAVGPGETAGFAAGNVSTELLSPAGPGVRAGTVIGPYTLLRQIGEGGMGTVFMAEQTEPVKRKVALKVIKPGMDSKQVIARFEAERQVLAMMNHVNIARVIDVGTTDADRPYFVMELVHGVPITKYCDDNYLTPRERLKLFVPVCQAIQHAHQKGIIHRDIKPSNVMVTLYDGKPVPKVIDFGVAKATEQKLTERTLFTQFGTMVGSLEYMSPEQAELSALGVDTRSDIYSLGVLLYELLTGSTPLTNKRLKETAYADILRLIKEEEPPKPSTRLSDSGESLPSISAQRNMEPSKLTKLVRGELDWIVMKCLEKDRGRRYETANAFAADMQRYLDDETVQACPPSAVYQLRKFVLRNKGPVLAVAIITLSLLGGIVGTILALTEARGQRRQAKESLEQARQSEAETMAVLGFFENRVLNAAKPKGYGQGLGRDVTIREAMDKAEPEIGQTFAEKPLAEASIRRVLGITYWHMGDYAKAIGQHERALALREAHWGTEHHDTLNSMSNLGQAYQSASRLNDALRILEKTLELEKTLHGPDKPNTLWTMNRLAETLQSLGRHAEALPLYEGELIRAKATLGPNHTDTMIYMDKLAGCYFRLGRRAEALRLFEETLKVEELNLAPDHPDRLATMGNLAFVYSDLGRWDEAIPLQSDVLAISKTALAADHPETIINIHNLGVSYRDVGRIDDARPLLEEALRLQTIRLGRAHHLTSLMANNLAMLYRDNGRMKEALALFQESLNHLTAKFGAEHTNRYLLMNHTAACLLKMQRHEESAALSRDCLRLRERNTPGEWWVWQTKSQLGQAMIGLKRYSEAEALLLEAYPELVSRRDTIPARFQYFMGEAALSLAELYEAWGRKEPAVPWREKAEFHQQETKVRKREAQKK